MWIHPIPVTVTGGVWMEPRVETTLQGARFRPLLPSTVSSLLAIEGSTLSTTGAAYAASGAWRA